MEVFIPSAGRVLLPARAAGRGGSGTVYRAQNLAVKVLHPAARTPEVMDRVQALLGFPPDPRFALPRDEVFDGPNGTIIGYAMPWMEGVPFLCLLDDRAAKKVGVTFTPLERLAGGEKLAALYDAAHRDLHVIIGDGNESNFLITWGPGGEIGVAGIDCDEYGFSARNPRTGRPVVYAPSRGKEPYLSPSLQGVDLRTASRTEDDDAFTLGTLLFNAVVGVHPFAVVAPPGSAPPGPVGARIRNGLWPYDPKVTLPAGWRPAGDNAFRSLPGPIQDLFRVCFVQGHNDPSSRPRPAVWQTALAKWIADERLSPRYPAQKAPPTLPSRRWSLSRHAELILRAIWSLGPARAAWWLRKRAGRLGVLLGLVQALPARSPGGQASRQRGFQSSRRWRWAAAAVGALLVSAAVAVFLPRTDHTKNHPVTPPVSSPREGDHPRWREAPDLWKDLLNEDP